MYIKVIIIVIIIIHFDSYTMNDSTHGQQSDLDEMKNSIKEMSK